MRTKTIPFSPPDISELEIEQVIAVLRSGWITSGPMVARFEANLKDYCGVEQAVAISSATAGMELLLKVFGLREGDEAITTPYTYTATASIMTHRGIRPVFVDVKQDSFFLDEQRLYEAITPRTKLISTVDFGGVPMDYDAVRAVVRAKGREDIILLSDSAHSFGASYQGAKVGGQFDFHVFSFHAVKNLTTAEGGAITFRDNHFRGKADLYQELKVTALHGQTKDAMSKMKAGAWKYDIVTDGYKCNMTDIMAAIGLGQLERFDAMVAKRRALFELYSETLLTKEWAKLPFRAAGGTETCYHLYPLRITGFSEEQRDRLIQLLAEEGIATNVHFVPLPMFSFYQGLGYSIADYPNAYQQYANEITLPLYSTLATEDAEYVADRLIHHVERLLKRMAS
ncbi:dTDP-4-amino-4,6-dideoxygalactose transaminase [Hydrogenispora ethanolica]|jgi:dTDP-4-amino-4,6-dideoxygalactose transaminase|uniref:dTDP-4-amino-4,6-dideoxygalactose transaminase n=1 Tax=Hydrogenispora ethanolica TaxID=1082276 RepID=A0A4R1SCV4_HYDET|nr:DegT/DnrJ/EryC1/StrS aminotransferase family protein [Hydrogenispora ethanolica]TCL76432.1 dTDP-4-amino-4,6-dideoxygalactose transaminase [Hydrogenispora ethanolica]